MPSLTVPGLLDQVKTSALSALIPHSLDFYKSWREKTSPIFLEGLAHRSPEITHCDLEVTSREDGVGREDGRKTEGRKEDGQC